MPYLGDRVTRLYYDASCPPCRLLATTAQGVSRHRVTAVPLDAPAADAELGRLPEPARYGSAHLSTGSALASGEEIVLPLVGLTFGRSWERVLRGAPFLGRGLKDLYLRLWAVRNSRGCGTQPPD